MNPQPIDAYHADLLQRVRVARETGGPRYRQAQADLRRYLAELLKKDAA